MTKVKSKWEANGNGQSGGCNVWRVVIGGEARAKLANGNFESNESDSTSYRLVFKLSSRVEV